MNVCELPYDVMSTEEARQIAAGNPLSFLHVSKAEIDFPPGTDVHGAEVYLKARENFRALMEKGVLQQDGSPRFYFYRQVMGSHSQTGLVGVASCEEYLQGIIKKHELTRPDKEDDRVRHIETLNAQTGPVFLTYRAQAALDEFMARKTVEKPDIDLTAADGVRHSSWSVTDTQEIEWIGEQFGAIPALYIADGHHRSAAAGRVFKRRGGAGQSGYFLAVIFPHNQLQILPYNRVLKDCRGLKPVELMEKLDGIFVVQRPGAPTPGRKHQIGFYYEGQWQTLVFREHFVRTSDPLEKLDVSLLQRFVLEPIFGIDDPRRSERIQFVGGIRGTKELEKLVNSGEYACAFSMYPTSIDDLMAVSDRGGIMPPKSTWFEPKLRDAMFCHLI